MIPRRWVAVALVAAAAACGNGPAGVEALPGTYTPTTVGGKSLPTVFTHASGAWTYVFRSIVLHEDRSFTWTRSVDWGGFVDQVTLTGTYSSGPGGRLTMHVGGEGRGEARRGA